MLDCFNHAFETDNKIVIISQYSGWWTWEDFDIYDPGSDSWSVGKLPQPTTVYSSVISVNNQVYIAGGFECPAGACQYLTQIWKLQF